MSIKKKRKKVYFAHSMQMYNTDLERELLDWLRDRYVKVIDPNKDIGELGSMEPYLRIVDTCNIVVCYEYLDYLSRGTYNEVKHALKHKKPAFVLRRDILGKITIEPVLGVRIVDKDDWTMRYGKIKDWR